MEQQLRLRADSLESELSRAVRDHRLAADREEALRGRLAEREEAWTAAAAGRDEAARATAAVADEELRATCLAAQEDLRVSRLRQCVFVCKAVGMR